MTVGHAPDRRHGNVPSIRAGAVYGHINVMTTGEFEGRRCLIVDTWRQFKVIARKMR